MKSRSADRGLVLLLVLHVSRQWAAVNVAENCSQPVIEFQLRMTSINVPKSAANLLTRSVDIQSDKRHNIMGIIDFMVCNTSLTGLRNVFSVRPCATLKSPAPVEPRLPIACNRGRIPFGDAQLQQSSTFHCPS